MRVGLVGCVKTKLEHPAPARDLYVSALFRGRRRHVEATCDVWFVLSARHGLVRPEVVVAPYEETLVGRTVQSKRAWAERVLAELDAALDVAGCVVEIHAGADYREFGLVDGLRARGATVEVPAEGLSQGRQLALYGAAGGAARERRSGRPAAAAGRRPPSLDRGSSYAPLARHLRGLDAAVAAIRFGQIERILGRPLPASARRHRAWWANETSGTHSHARAWLGEGWRVDAVDLNAGVVRFGRR